LKQLEYCHNLVSQVKPSEEQTIEYGSNQVMLIARFIQDITRNANEHGASFAQQYILQKGLKVFGNKGHKASKEEIDQLHRRTCFAPLSDGEGNEAIQKEEGANGTDVPHREEGQEQERKNGIQRKANKRMDIARGYSSDQSERRERRDDMQHTERFHSSVTTTKKDPGKERVVMKITGVLVDMLVNINPELYGPAVVLEN
jgi:hypothetical protein